MNKKILNLIITVSVLAIVIIGAFLISKNFAIDSLNKSVENTQNEKASNNDSEEKPKVKAPTFTLEDLNGDTHSLDQYKGKIVVLNFWGSWCKYCVEEMPDFQELHNEFEEDGDIVLLAINNTTTESNKSAAINYIERNNFNMNFIFDLDGSVSNSYNITGYPTTFVIDEDGYVYGYQAGKISKEVLLSAINKLKEEGE